MNVLRLPVCWAAMMIVIACGRAHAATEISDTSMLPRVTAVLDGVAAATNGPPAPLGHAAIFIREPEGQLVWPPPLPIDPARAALQGLDTATNEFEAPPLLVTSITALPADSGLSVTQLVERFERNLLRERVILADRLYRQGDSTNAIALLKDLDQYLRNPRNRLLNINRLAAYHFRAQKYEAAVTLMRQAVELDRRDALSSLNLAAVLLMVGRLDEALNHLLAIYPSTLERPQFAFSVHFNLACVYSLKGDMDKALQNLAIASQIDPASTLASLGDPQLDYARTDERFRELGVALEKFTQRKR